MSADNFELTLAQYGGWTDEGGGDGFLRAGLFLDDSWHKKDWTPASADYSVTLDIDVKGTPLFASVYAVGRWTGDDTGDKYIAAFTIASGEMFLTLKRRVANMEIDLGVTALEEVPAQVTLRMQGSTIRAEAGADFVSVVDTSITGAGAAGVYGAENLDDPENRIRISKFATTDL